jgi:hypothetical protein
MVAWKTPDGRGFEEAEFAPQIDLLLDRQNDMIYANQ